MSSPVRRLSKNKKRKQRGSLWPTEITSILPEAGGTSHSLLHDTWNFSRLGLFWCFYKTNWLYSYWWIGGGTLYNAKVWICVISVTPFLWRVEKRVWMIVQVTFCSDLIFVKPFSIEQDLTRNQTSRCNKTDSFKIFMYLFIYYTTDYCRTLDRKQH